MLASRAVKRVDFLSHLFSVNDVRRKLHMVGIQSTVGNTTVETTKINGLQGKSA